MEDLNQGPDEMPEEGFGSAFTVYWERMELSWS